MLLDALKDSLLSTGCGDAIAEALGKAQPTVRKAMIVSLGQSIFGPSSRDLRDEATLNGRDLNDQAARGGYVTEVLARRLETPDVEGLAASAVAALGSRLSSPVEQLIAARFLLNARGRLQPADRQTAAKAVVAAFANRPEIAEAARSALSPQGEARP